MTTPQREPWTVEDIPVCNCAGCGRELLGAIPHYRAKELKSLLANKPRGIPRRSVTARLDGRPYCRVCFDARTRPPTRFGASQNGRRVNDKPAPQ